MVPWKGIPEFLCIRVHLRFAGGLADSNWCSLRIHGKVFSTADIISALVEVVLAVSITQLRARFTTVRTNER